MFSGRRQPSRGDTSRMNREVQVRICEGLGVKLPGPTQKDLANQRPPMPSLITTLGGLIAAVCSRCQSRRNYEFAMDTSLRK